MRRVRCRDKKCISFIACMVGILCIILDYFVYFLTTGNVFELHQYSPDMFVLNSLVKVILIGIVCYEILLACKYDVNLTGFIIETVVAFIMALIWGVQVANRWKYFNQLFAEGLILTWQKECLRITQVAGLVLTIIVAITCGIIIYIKKLPSTYSHTGE